MNVQIFFLLASVVTSSLGSEEANITSFLYTNENGETWLEDLTLEPNLTASANDVMLYFFSRKNPAQAFVFKSNDISTIQKSGFIASKPTVFVIHGWQNNHGSEVCTKVKDELLSAFDVNVFAVDWGAIAKKNYVTAQAAVAPVGQIVGGFIKLLEGKGLNMGNVKLVGHSLGAHIAGNVGASLGGKVNSITGLDPAGPLFTMVNKKNRLDKSDASFVEAIHTNAGKLGVNFQIGHADYWPNGGKLQPGCKVDVTGSCSHSRSHQYYAESVRSNKFVAHKCGDFNSFKAGKCKAAAAATMGMYQVDRRANGAYYLNTKSSSPFAEG